MSVHLATQFQRRIACGGHVYNGIGTKLAILIEDLPYMLPTRFRFIWPIGFRGNIFLEIDQETIFLEIDQSETRITCGSHVF
jgi:hypothetical protein